MNAVTRAALAWVVLSGCFEAHEMGQWISVPRADAGEAAVEPDAGRDAPDAGSDAPDVGNGLRCETTVTFGGWESTNLGSVYATESIWANAPDDVWIGGYTTLHFDGQGWTELDETSIPHGVWGLWGGSRGDVWGVSDEGAIFHRTAGSSWQGVPSGTTVQLRQVWGLSDTDIWAIGRAGTILHFDGSTWSDVPSGTTQDLGGIWGSSSTDVWAVTAGPTGQVLHWDGVSWEIDPSVQISYAGLAGAKSIWGSSATDVWIVGDRLLHWNGTAWSTQPSPESASYLTAILGTAADDVWVAEKGGRMVHWDGAAWTMCSVTNGELVNIGGLAGTSNGEVWATVWSNAQPDLRVLHRR